MSLLLEPLSLPQWGHPQEPQTRNSSLIIFDASKATYPGPRKSWSLEVVRSALNLPEWVGQHMRFKPDLNSLCRIHRKFVTLTLIPKLRLSIPSLIFYRRSHPHALNPLPTWLGLLLPPIPGSLRVSSKSLQSSTLTWSLMTVYLSPWDIIHHSRGNGMGHSASRVKWRSSSWKVERKCKAIISLWASAIIQIRGWWRAWTLRPSPADW